MPAVNYGSLPFAEQIEFFRGKLNLDTHTWGDIQKDMHARAFVVAGARGQVLADFQQAVLGTIARGDTLATFRKNFDGLVAAHGWDYNGSRNWRSRVIYDTNLRTSYAAGRYAQLQAIKHARPYWEFHHTPVRHPRLSHLAWDGITLPADDPWWDDHYPPSGWGCQCTVFSHSADDLAAAGKNGPDTAPDDGTYIVGKGPFKGERVPNGIDPGWNYNVGKAAWGKRLEDGAFAQARATGQMAWQPLRAAGITGHDWRSLGRPEHIPLDTPHAALAQPLATADETIALTRRVLGADERTFNVGGYPMLVNAESLGAHMDPRRAQYLPLLPEALAEPFEIWLGFMHQPATGKVALRARVIKAFDLGAGRGIVTAFDAQGGALNGYTFIPPRSLSYLNNQRWGMLLYGRESAAGAP